MSRERSLFEWFTMLEDSGDEHTISIFFATLDYYRGNVTDEDRQQLINLFAAVRMHQLKNTRMPGDS